MRFAHRNPFASAAVFSMAAVLVLAANRASSGSLVNVQFASSGQFPSFVWATGQPFSGAAAIGSAGDYWNPVLSTYGEDQVQQVPLLDSTQAATGVQLLVKNSGGWSDDNAANRPFSNTPVAALMEQYDFSHTTGVFQITNLTPGAYDLYVYSAGDYDGQNRVTDVRVFNLDDTYDVQGSVGPNNAANSLVEGVNYIRFQPTVGVDGALTIEYWGTVPDLSGPQGNINGFQLSYAPEPTALALIGLLPAVGLLRRSRASRFRHSH